MPSTLHCVLAVRKVSALAWVMRNGFHPDAFKQAKELLTGGTRLENGPRVQGFFGAALAIWSGAVICSAH